MSYKKRERLTLEQAQKLFVHPKFWKLVDTMYGGAHHISYDQCYLRVYTKKEKLKFRA